MNDRLLISFSGGETSALMTHLLLTKWRDKYADMRVVFANTGQENEATLDFVRRCEQFFGFSAVWVEAVPQAEKLGTAHRVVNYETASRSGEPFEAVIQKYGVPNSKFSHCTRELKLRPITHWARAQGWAADSYDTAIGVRADEARRRSDEPTYVYPLLDWLPLDKPGVNKFWSAQPFRLQLAGYQGNCKTCWKKSNRKLLTLIDENPAQFDFFDRMEREYGLVGPEFKKTTVPGYRRVFFRGNRSVQDLRAAHAKGGWDSAVDDALDTDSGCSESCEVFEGAA
jgi:hypothetical protein